MSGVDYPFEDLVYRVCIYMITEIHNWAIHMRSSRMV